jgi:hypothetical protein
VNKRLRSALTFCLALTVSLGFLPLDFVTAQKERVEEKQTESVEANTDPGAQVKSLGRRRDLLSPTPNITPETEPNDTTATANVLNLTAQNVTIVSGTVTFPPGDRDHFTFTAPAGAKLWAFTDTGGIPVGNSTDSVLTLLASDGSTIIELDNNDGTGNGGDGTTESSAASSIAGRTLTAGGTYFLRVEDVDNDGVINPYRLFVVVTTVAIQSETEANNTSGTADVLVTSTKTVGVVDGNISPGTDSDFYAVQATAGNILAISLDLNPSRTSDTNVEIELRSTNGTTVLLMANSSGDNPADTPFSEAFNYVITTSGTYFVRVFDNAATLTGNYNLMVAAANSDPIPREVLDFDGDDRADYAVITSGGAIPPETLSPKSPKQRIRAGIPRPISKEINGGGSLSWEILFSNGGSASIPFGNLGDFPIPGQFTSDNRTDIAVWDPLTQQFLIRRSEGGPTIITPAIGDAFSDPTVLGDYTGDGIDDPCVFTGTQWIYLPNNGNGTFGAAVTVSFGQLGDFPSPGDYNDDGLDDFGVSRPDAGNPNLAHFFLDYNGVTPGVSDADGVFGESDDVIVPADYDGDGETEIAVADVTGFPFIRWVYFSSATGVVIGHAWGDNTIGFQAQADYDGDNIDDIAVWHSDPTGTFFVRRSSDLAAGIQSWGLSTDYPVAYYRSH